MYNSDFTLLSDLNGMNGMNGMKPQHQQSDKYYDLDYNEAINYPYNGSTTFASNSVTPVLNTPNGNNLGWANVKKNGFYFQSSTEKFNDLLQTYGTPEGLIYGYGGMAVWTNKDFYDKIELYDRMNINNWPIPHNSILTLYVHVKIDRDKWLQIQKICSNVLYNFMNNMLIIQAPNIGYGNALLAIILRYVYDEITWNDINDQPLVKSKVALKRLTNPKELDKDIMTIRKLLHK